MKKPIVPNLKINQLKENVPLTKDNPIVIKPDSNNIKLNRSLSEISAISRRPSGSSESSFLISPRSLDLEGTGNSGNSGGPGDPKDPKSFFQILVDNIDRFDNFLKIILGEGKTRDAVWGLLIGLICLAITVVFYESLKILPDTQFGGFFNGIWILLKEMLKGIKDYIVNLLGLISEEWFHKNDSCQTPLDTRVEQKVSPNEPKETTLEKIIETEVNTRSWRSTGVAIVGGVGVVSYIIIRTFLR